MKVNLSIVNDAGQDSVTVDLSESDDQLLRKFLEEYDRLLASKPLQEDIPCGLNINFTTETGFVITPNVPSADDLAILLHRLRPFLLQNEPYSLQRTGAVFGRLFRHPALREALKHIHRLSSGENVRSQIPIVLNNEELKTEELLLDWLNSHEYHRDPEKASQINKLRQQLPAPFFDFLIVSLTLDKLRAVICCAKFSSLLFGKLVEVSFRGFRFLNGGA